MLKQLRELFEQHPDIKLVILFGSQAKGSATSQSDVDIAVMADKPLTVEIKTLLIKQIAELAKCPVDLIDLKTAGEPLLGQILRGKLILGDKKVYAQLLTRHLLDAADFLPLQQRILKERRDAWINS